MRLLAVLGSPHKNGNTSLLLDQYLKGVKEGADDSHVENVFLQDKKISPCRACNACRDTGSLCIINDDMSDLYGKFIDADVIVIATPIYWWNISAQVKIFIDRLYALDVEKDYVGKKLVLLMTYGGELPNSGPEYVEKIFRDICDYLHMDFIQVYGACTDENVPVAENYQAQEEAYSMGKDLNKFFHS